MALPCFVILLRCHCLSLAAFYRACVWPIRLSRLSAPRFTVTNRVPMPATIVQKRDNPLVCTAVAMFRVWFSLKPVIYTTHRSFLIRMARARKRVPALNLRSLSTPPSLSRPASNTARTTARDSPEQLTENRESVCISASMDSCMQEQT